MLNLHLCNTQEIPLLSNIFVSLGFHAEENHASFLITPYLVFCISLHSCWRWLKLINTSSDALTVLIEYIAWITATLSFDQWKMKCLSFFDYSFIVWTCSLRLGIGWRCVLSSSIIWDQHLHTNCKKSCIIVAETCSSCYLFCMNFLDSKTVGENLHDLNYEPKTVFFLSEFWYCSATDIKGSPCYCSLHQTSKSCTKRTSRTFAFAYQR